MNRREFFRTGLVAAAPALGTAAHALSPLRENDQYDFLFPTVEFHCHDTTSDRWNYYPGCVRNLIREFGSVVRCRVKEPQNCHDGYPRWGNESHFNAVVTLKEIEPLREFPFLFMTAEGEYTLSTREKEILKQYIHEGGFILMDDCIRGHEGDYFYQSSYKMLEEVFGQGSVKLIDRNHEIYNNVYDMRDVGLPLAIGHGTNHGGQGLFIGDRIAVFLSSTDLHCAWTGYSSSGPLSIQLGINIIMYALSH